MYWDEFEPSFVQFKSDLKYCSIFQERINNQDFQEVERPF